MTKTKKAIIGGIGILSLLLFAVLAMPFFSREELEPIKIGVIVPVSEKGTSDEALAGMRLSIEEINEKGGVNGRKIELIVPEYELVDDEHILRALNEMEQIHKPLAYVSVDGEGAVLTAEFAEEHEVVHFITYVALDKTADKDWVFQYSIPATEYFEVGAFLFNTFEVDRLSFIYETDDVSGPIIPTLTPEILGRPGMSIELHPFPGEDTNVRRHITESFDADAIYIYTLWPSRVRDIVMQIRELNYQGKIFTSDIFTNPDISDPDGSTGVYIGVPIVHRSDYLFAQRLREEFEKSYDDNLFSFFNQQAAEGYDILRLISELLKLENEVPTREGLRTIFESGFSYDGIFGNIHVEPGEHYIEVPLYPAQYVENGLEYL